MRRYLTIAILLAACAVIISLVYTKLPMPLAGHTGGSAAKSLQIKGHTVRVTVADTPETRAQGLGGREGLAPDEGMLFVFDEDGYHTFWMKDMRFSIDIVWLSALGSVVDIEEHVSPESYPATVSPDTPSRYVLELPAGYVGRHSVERGDLVTL